MPSCAKCRACAYRNGVTTDSAGAPVQKGDRVVYAAVFPCYSCHQCLRGNTNWCMNRNYPAAGAWPYFTGTYADFLYLPPRHPFFRVPDEQDDDLLGPVNCAMGTVTTGLIRAGAGEGDYVVIQGAGGLGVHATAMAKEMGADRVGKRGNRLGALSGNRRGQYSIRVNLQWRVCFRWSDDGPYDVELVDYH